MSWLTHEQRPWLLLLLLLNGTLVNQIFVTLLEKSKLTWHVQLRPGWAEGGSRFSILKCAQWDFGYGAT